MPYFERTGPTTFRATEHVGGAWNTDEQHIAPSLGLMTHAVEADHRRRRDGDVLAVSRLSFDILGVLPIDEVDLEVRVLRAGRTIELVEAVLSHAGRPAVLVRAWLLAERDTAALAGSDLPPLPSPDAMPCWDPTEVWPGGFIASARLRRDQESPGRARYWVRTDVPLLDEPTSPLASAAGLFDIANGMTVRVAPTEVAFPNVDLTAHLFRSPRPGWLGFDTTVSFGPDGRGLTSSRIHDEDGPVGTLAQTLTVRPA
ncbi:thioesterase family protein [Nocardioides sp. CER19]|uniref:thioesterase family protein n=1 Tax=Nocardioides sp. CER19 TaxID=3038538 RepID=UPI00244B78D9|nr:thioesterase family protein [Nocardioides sp. CER19]MDH2413119.1 thioesterase family protein [Nocardioides sp. CER19]